MNGRNWIIKYIYYYSPLKTKVFHINNNKYYFISFSCTLCCTLLVSLLQWYRNQNEKAKVDIKWSVDLSPVLVIFKFSNLRTWNFYYWARDYFVRSHHEVVKFHFLIMLKIRSKKILQKILNYVLPNINKIHC